MNDSATASVRSSEMCIEDPRTERMSSAVDSMHSISIHDRSVTSPSCSLNVFAKGLHPSSTDILISASDRLAPSEEPVSNIGADYIHFRVSGSLRMPKLLVCLSPLAMR